MSTLGTLGGPAYYPGLAHSTRGKSFDTYSRAAGGISCLISLSAVPNFLAVTRAASA